MKIELNDKMLLSQQISASQKNQQDDKNPFLMLYKMCSLLVPYIWIFQYVDMQTHMHETFTTRKICKMREKSENERSTQKNYLC